MFKILLTVAALLVSQSLNAADIASDVRSGGNPLNEDGGYFELGVSAGYANSPLKIKQAEDGLEDDGSMIDIDGAGEYRFKGFFIEATQGSQDGLNLGYTAWKSTNWTLDILAASMNGFYDTDLDIDIRPGDSEAERNRKLYNRNTLYSGAGVRLSVYVNEYVMQYRLLTDTKGGNGVISSARVGRGWQYRNWNFHGILSTVYTSEKTNTYLYGVSESEATARYPAYAPGSGISYSLFLGVARPINEKWVFRAYTGYYTYPDAATNSAFVDQDNGSFLFLSVNRVFNLGL